MSRPERTEPQDKRIHHYVRDNTNQEEWWELGRFYAIVGHKKTFRFNPTFTQLDRERKELNLSQEVQSLFPIVLWNLVISYLAYVYDITVINSSHEHQRKIKRKEGLIYGTFVSYRRHNEDHSHGTVSIKHSGIISFFVESMELALHYACSSLPMFCFQHQKDEIKKVYEALETAQNGDSKLLDAWSWGYGSTYENILVSAHSVMTELYVKFNCYLDKIGLGPFKYQSFIAKLRRGDLVSIPLRSGLPILHLTNTDWNRIIHELHFIDELNHHMT